MKHAVGCCNSMRWCLPPPYAALFSGVVYPIFGHWACGSLSRGFESDFGGGRGWLESLRFHDFAGSLVVHGLGGASALAGIMVVGPRLGKYAEDGTPPGHCPASPCCVSAVTLPSSTMLKVTSWPPVLAAMKVTPLRASSCVALRINQVTRITTSASPWFVPRPCRTSSVVQASLALGSASTSWVPFRLLPISVLRRLLRCARSK